MMKLWIAFFIIHKTMGSQRPILKKFVPTSKVDIGQLFN